MERFSHAAKDATRFLDNILDASSFPSERYTEVTRKTRPISLGIMGLADTLALLELL
jgi:ribonucleoside-diphosphate reductase alpha chain